MFEKISIIIVVNLILYFRTLRFRFVSDDFSVWRNPPAWKNKWHMRWFQLMGQAKLRSRAFIPMWDKKSKRKFKIVKIDSEEQEHLLALVLHIFLCCMIYIAFGKNNISFIAALFYATNPVNNQGTIWPGGRGYVIPAISILVAYAWPIISPLALFCSVWFTIGFLAPLAFIGSAKWYILLSLPLVYLIVMKKFTTAVKNKSGAESFAEDRRFHFRKIVVFIKTFGFYFLLCIIPFRITFYHSFLQSMSGNEIMRRRAYKMDKFFWIGIIVGFTWLGYAIHRWDTLAWSMFAFMITAAPFCNLIRANQEIAERFIALPNIFLMFMLAQIVGNNPVAVGCFITFYAVRTYYTMILYKDEYYITECAVIEDPFAWWAWHCRAMKRWDTQSYREALLLWTMARMISPKEFKILMNLATVLRLLKNDKEADYFLKEAERNIVEGQEKESMEFINNHKKGKLPILL